MLPELLCQISPDQEIASVTADGAWVEREQPQFGPGIADRFRTASSITATAWVEARRVRDAARARLAGLLADGAMLVLPTGPGPAPLRNADNATLDAFRTHALHMLCPRRPGRAAAGVLACRIG